MEQEQCKNSGKKRTQTGNFGAERTTKGTNKRKLDEFLLPRTPLVAIEGSGRKRKTYECNRKSDTHCRGSVVHSLNRSALGSSFFLFRSSLFGFLSSLFWESEGKKWKSRKRAVKSRRNSAGKLERSGQPAQTKSKPRRHVIFRATNGYLLSQKYRATYLEQSKGNGMTRKSSKNDLFRTVQVTRKLAYD